VVINNFYIIDITFFPTKTDPVLIVDADTVLTFPGSLQGFQAVPRWHSQIIKTPCAM
jgi:hypothetical protein